MRRNPSATSFESADRQSLLAHGRPILVTSGVVLLVLGWALVAVAHRIGGVVHDAHSNGALILTSGVVVGALVAIGVGCALAIAAAESPTRYVFHSRPTLVVASFLLLGGAVIAAALIIRQPFDRFISHGELTARTVRDIGCILASVASFVGGGAASFAAWDARHQERAWTRRPMG